MYFNYGSFLCPDATFDPECSAHDELLTVMGDTIDEHHSRFPDHVMIDVAPRFEQGLHSLVFSSSPLIAQLTFHFV